MSEQQIVAHVPVSDEGPWMVGVEAAETRAEALERCAAWLESLASPMLGGDPFIRATDWAAKLIREFVREEL